MSDLVEKVQLAVIKIWQNEGGNYTDAPAGTRLDTSAVTRAAIAAVAEWLAQSEDRECNPLQCLSAALRQAAGGGE